MDFPHFRNSNSRLWITGRGESEESLFFNFRAVCLLWYFYSCELKGWYHFIDSFEEKYKLKVYNKKDERWKKRVKTREQRKESARMEDIIYM